MVTDRRNEKIKKVISNRQAGIVVILEDIHDPHNAEAILRSCDAFGVQKVFLSLIKRNLIILQRLVNQARHPQTNGSHLKFFTRLVSALLH